MSNEREVLLPDIGDFDTVDVIEVLVKPGDRVQAEDGLITLESDKASMEVPSPSPGTVKKLLVKVGDKLAQGAPILILEEQSGEDESTVIKPDTEPEPVEVPLEAAAATQAPPEPAAVPVPPQGLPQGAQTVRVSRSARAHAGPSVRRLARELGIDLGLVTGSGRKGRIVKADLKAFAKSVLSGARVDGEGVATSSATVPPVDFSRFGEIELRPLSRLRRVAGQNLQRAWTSIPQVTQFDQGDITELEEFRRSKLELAARRDIRLTLVAFIIKAVVVALREFPDFNASLTTDGQALVLKKYFHIGVAVNTDNGLLVPVVRDVEQMGVMDLAKEVQQLAKAARDGKLTPAQMQGGCFTISSLGGVGGTGFTPIINAPEVAILGVSKAVTQAVYSDGQWLPRLILPLSLSYDHRVIDGVAAARFSGFLGEVLSDIRDILL